MDAISSPTPNSYLDFDGLGQLKGQARTDAKSAIKQTAQQFEALFLQMMMKSMRESIVKSEMSESSTMETFEGMFDKEVSLQMSRRGALGVGDFLERAVRQRGLPPPSTEALLQARGKAMPLNLKPEPMNLPTPAELSKGFALEKPMRIKSMQEFMKPFSGGAK